MNLLIAIGGPIGLGLLVGAILYKFDPDRTKVSSKYTEMMK